MRPYDGAIAAVACLLGLVVGEMIVWLVKLAIVGH